MKLETEDAEWVLEAVSEWIVDKINAEVTTAGVTKRRLNARDIPHYRRHHRMRQFVTRTIQWVRKYKIKLDEKGVLRGVPAKVNWKYGSFQKAPKFDWVFQVQHLQIIVRVPGDDCAISVRDIITRENFIPTIRNIKKKDISFAKLQTLL